MSLQLLENLLKFAGTLHMRSIDVCYDIRKPIKEVLTIPNMFNLANLKKKIDLSKDRNENLTGLTIGTQNTKQKYVIYDKNLKNKLTYDLTRVELTQREEFIITEMLDVKSYISLIKSEFETQLNISLKIP